MTQRLKSQKYDLFTSLPIIFFLALRSIELHPIKYSGLVGIGSLVKYHWVTALLLTRVTKKVYLAHDSQKRNKFFMDEN